MDQPFAVDDLPAEPWRNGRGITRTVAVDAGAGDWRWRISLADLSGTAPFSRFAGVDRQAVLVRGSGLVLTVDGVSSELAAAGQRLDFAGESEVWSATPRGPARLWNVMTRRGGARAEACWLQEAATLPAGGVRLLLAVDAGCRVRAGRRVLTLAPGCCWMPPEDDVALEVAAGDGGGLLFTRITVAGGFMLP